jgi:hypothetical protein
VTGAAGEEPDRRFAPQAAIVLSELLEQARAEYDVPILAAFAFLDVEHHAGGVDVGNLQRSHLGRRMPVAYSVIRIVR